MNLKPTFYLCVSLTKTDTPTDRPIILRTNRVMVSHTSATVQTVPEVIVGPGERRRCRQV